MTDQIPFLFEVDTVPPATGELVNTITIQACEAHTEKRLMLVHPEIILALAALIDEQRRGPVKGGDVFNDILAAIDFDFDTEAAAINVQRTTVKPFEPSVADQMHMARWGEFPDFAKKQIAEDTGVTPTGGGKYAVTHSDEEIMTRSLKLQDEADKAEDAGITERTTWRAMKRRELQLEGFSEIEVKIIMVTV